MRTPGEQIVGRLNNMYDQMDDGVAPYHLRCSRCDHTEPSKPAGGGSYFRTGWPVCCGETMKLERTDEAGVTAKADEHGGSTIT